MSVWGKVRQVFGVAAADGGQASPRDLFAVEVEKAALTAPGVTSVRRAPEGFGLIVSHGAKDRTLFLDNVFAETRDLAPEQRRERIARFIRSMDAPDAATMTWDEVRPKLAPLLRPSTLFSSVPGISGTDKQPIGRPFAPFLIECVGIDSDDGIAYAAPSTIAKWGVQEDDVFAASLENGRNYFVEDVAPFDPTAPYPIWHVARDDSYESSRILVPGWLAAFSGKVNGRPVAIVPERSTLVVGGDGDERCLRRLIASAKGEFMASPRRISPALYTIDDDGRVVPLVVPAGHPLAADVALGHVMMGIAEYDVQQERLQKQLGEDVFVAPYKGLRGESGSVFSFTTWTKGVSTLLPKADQVAMVCEPETETGAVFRVPWSTLVDMVGDCLVRDAALEPPRWRTARWPEEQVLAKLRAACL
jgi:hypothetical protein